MLGAIIGDIVGSRFEFNNAKTTRFDLFAKECSFTDDTIGAITGSLAEAHYGIPAAMRDAGLTYLPPEMKKIVDQFYDRVG